MLLTDWLVLAVAGATIDGREIEEKWLEEIAESYDRESYTANINVDHFNWYGNYGQVHDVRLSKNKNDEVVLEGRLNPNHYLVQMNKDGQKLFLSVEITTNYRGTGKAYLTGLALTDQPASAGTSQLKFSRKNNDFVYTSPRALLFKLPNGEETLTEETLLSRFISLLNGSDKNQAQEFQTITAEQDEPEMSAEQLEKLSEQIKDITTSIESLSEVISGIAEKFSEENNGDDKGDQEPPKDQGDGDSEFKSISEEIEKLSATIKEMQKEVPGKFKQEDHSGDNQQKRKFI